MGSYLSLSERSLSISNINGEASQTASEYNVIGSTTTSDSTPVQFVAPTLQPFTLTFETTSPDALERREGFAIAIEIRARAVGKLGLLAGGRDMLHPGAPGPDGRQ